MVVSCALILPYGAHAAAYFGRDVSWSQYRLVIDADTRANGGFSAAWYDDVHGRGLPYNDGPTRRRLCWNLAEQSHPVEYTHRKFTSPGDNYIFKWNGEKWQVLRAANYNNFIYSIVCYAPTPSCTVTFDKNPIPYGDSTTIRWSSTYAASMYIKTTGYVTENSSGSATVKPTLTTGYSCTAEGSGGTGAQSASLVVTPPSVPSASISASSPSIPVGSFTTITATFAAGSGDALAHNNIDSPAGTGLAASTNPDTSKTITFTPASAGTYTFYARIQTSYFPSWTTYASTNVVVSAAPACTISFDKNPVAKGQSTTVRWTSSNATAFTIRSIGSVTPNVSGSALVSPAQSTDYTGTASASGVSATCKAVTGNPQGTLNVSCTPAYSCSGSTIQYTDASCDVSNVTTCVSPGFCSAGSSICLYPAPAFNQSGNYTGHLQVNPKLVGGGGHTTVHWDVSNVSSCSVTGENGDSWSGASGSHTSGAINQQTTYTLSCAGLDGSAVHETAIVGVLPSYQEK